MAVALDLSRRLMRLPLEVLELDPDNVRTSYDEQHVADLRASLEDALRINQEYINPPVVYPVGKDRYRVKSGNCRVLAARDVVASLEVIVEDPPQSPGVKILDQLSENVLQGGLNPMDTARALRKLRDREELSIGGVTDLLQQRGIGRGRFWVQMHLDLTKLHPSVQESVERGDLPPRSAWELRSLKPVDQIAWAKRIAEQGLPLSAVTEAISGRAAPPADGEDELSLEERLRQAAEAFDAGQRTPAKRTATPEVERRWELVALFAARQPDKPTARTRALIEHSAYQKASESERALALEALMLGAGEPEDCLSLAKSAASQVTKAPEPVMNALNGVRQVLDDPKVLAGNEAVVRFLELRLRRALKELKA